MQDFFKSSRFKILLLLVALMFCFMLRAAYTQTGAPFMAKLTGLVLTPVQRVFSGGYHAVYNALSDFITAPAIARENQALMEENAQLNQQLVELARYKAENDQLKEFLDIKERNRDFMVEPAIVVGRDAGDRFYSFTIDKGSSDGIHKNDPVITGQGLVGMVTSVGLTHAKVLTILDTTVEVGVMDATTREIGIAEGTVELALDGKLRMSYLPRDSKAVVGDLVVTTGVGGLFPRDVILGQIEKIEPDAQGLTLSAIIVPPQDLRIVQSVMVIKGFDGQQEGE